MIDLKYEISLKDKITVKYSNADTEFTNTARCKIYDNEDRIYGVEQPIESERDEKEYDNFFKKLIGSPVKKPKKSGSTKSLNLDSKKNSGISGLNNISGNLSNIGGELRGSIGSGIGSMNGNRSRSYEILESNLSSTVHDIYSSDYISKLNYTDIDYDTFCICVFVTGLSYNNTSLIEKSEEYPASCHHSECSILASFQPEILHCYQNVKKRYQVDINPLTSNLCFPLGIKLCFKADEEYPKPYKTFLNIIRNEKGEVYYITTMQYYRKITVEEFEKKYKVNPLKEFTKFKNVLINDESTEEKFNNNLDIISSFIGAETLLIPESITLASRFGFITQMESCIKSLIQSKTTEIMNSMISHFINEIPIPSLSQKIFFYLPNYPNPIELASPFSPNTLNYTTNLVLKYLSVENIIFIFHLILLEQKILFIENDYSIVSEISYSFLSFIYPFFWVHTYIPVLSLTTVKFLQSFIPFVMGTDEFLLKYSIENEYIDKNSNNIVYVNLKYNTISLSPERNKKTFSKKSILKALNIPDLPEKITKMLASNIKEIKKDSESKINEELQQLFCNAMVRIIGDFSLHMFYLDSDSDMPLFNSECYLDDKKKEEKPFYTEFIATQLFHQFLFNEKECYKNKKRKNKLVNENVYGKIYDNSMVDITLFHKMLNQFKKKEDLKLSPASPKKSKSPKRSKTFHINLFNSNVNTSGINQFLSPRKEKEKDSTLLSADITKHSLLISPYFMSDGKWNELDKQKIEEEIFQSLQKDKVDKDDPFYIIDDKSLVYHFDSIKDKYRRYFFGLIDKKAKEEEIKPRKMRRKRSISSNALISSTFQDDIKDITEWFTNLCTAEIKNRRFKIIDVSSLMKVRTNREFFSNLIVQGDTLDESHKMINAASFSELLKAIKYSLLSLEENEFQNGKSLTLALFRYFTIYKKEIKYLYEDYIKKNLPYKMWGNENFWMEWYTEDVVNEEQFDESKNVVSGENSLSYRLAIRLLEIMFSLGVEQDVIKNVALNIGEKYLDIDGKSELSCAYHNMVLEYGDK